ncbi:LOW QUALITY PROTEIN: sodium/potassium-transporting ATPase subunit beta-1-interacting protein 3 [Trematomus bernacchii]|uniref:LOW QUALITY PROTEIN: sodium/potassium-transporting ATPase subunit beta-1-interacting protein 3 n=1 Tax=Trematomus bernacchii TaxID=40690 RepID=UPI00146D37D4|nr:LOW QUALITY PROTEIN: sodium/potassium-transporting ATPase subunit beta-1-interacting protein 3 [Trematomus bernacchii]
MGCCSARCTLILLCCLQLVSAVERQLFDFLGFQWASILINFLQILVVVLGLFGAVQYKKRLIIMYLLWLLLWGGLNVFVSCLYLEVGGLSAESDVLSLGVSSHRSWWKDHGPGCEGGIPSAGWQKTPNNHQNHQKPSEPSGPSGSAEPPGSWAAGLRHQNIEVLHCVLQLVLALPGFVYACYVASTFSDQEDNFNFIGDFHHPSKPSQLFF